MLCLFVFPYQTHNKSANCFYRNVRYNGVTCRDELLCYRGKPVRVQQYPAEYRVIYFLFMGWEELLQQLPVLVQLLPPCSVAGQVVVGVVGQVDRGRSRGHALHPDSENPALHGVGHGEESVPRVSSWTTLRLNTLNNLSSLPFLPSPSIKSLVKTT